MSLDYRQKAPSGTDGLQEVEALAVAAAVAWMAVVGVLFLLIPEAESTEAAFESIRWTLMAVVMFTPIALIAVALRAGRANRLLRHEVAKLSLAIDEMRHTYVAERGVVPSKAPEQVAAPIAPTEPPVEFISNREVLPKADPQAAPDPQPVLDLGQDALVPPDPINRADLIRALNFPDDENDTDGFAALRRALKDRSARLLVQASQDVLTLLSEDGIYTDTLHPDQIDPAVWRAFANGERGATVASVGAIQDDMLNTKIVQRLRDDSVFQDAGHHFMRLFDELLEKFAAQASDSDMTAFANTRTSRAFMLLARASNVFD